MPLEDDPMTNKLRATYRTVRLSLVRETASARYVQPRRIKSGRDVADLLRAFIADDPRELFVAVYLDGKHGVIAIHTVAIGCADSARVHPREVFAPGIQLGAVGIVVAHNHPSGDAEPSAEDRLITDRLKAAGELLGVELLDHVIVGADRFYTFADERYHPFPEASEAVRERCARQ